MYACVETILRAGTMRAWAPRSKPPVDQWCDQHRTLSTDGKGSSRAGKWDTSETPYLREPLRATINPEVRQISFQKSTQIGATEWLFCYVIYCIVVLKESLLYVYPTSEKGKEVNTDKLVPAIKNCPPAASLLEQGGVKAATRGKVRIGGSFIQFAYTKSKDSMRGDPFGKVINDEVDTFDYSGEDPIENGRSRQTTFADSLMLNVSTPMDDQTGITEMYEHSSVRWTYQTPCSKCGQFFELWDFSLVQWYGGLKVEPEIAAANCWIQCPQCDKRINLCDHRWMIQHGIWITQGEEIVSDGRILETLDRETRELKAGYEMLSMIGSDAFVDQGDEVFHGEQTREDPLRHAGRDTSPGGPGEAEEKEAIEKYGVRIVGHRAHGKKHGYRICTYQSLVSAEGIPGVVSDFVEANGHPKPTWWRDRMGRSPSTKGDRIEIHDIKLLCTGRELGGHSFGQCPPWTAALFGGIDHQQDCTKLLINAYGAQGKKKALVWTQIIPRREELKFADVLNPLLDIGPFEVIGAERRLTPAFFMDTGFWTHEVYELLRDLGRIVGKDRFIGCKGMPNPESRLHQPYQRSAVYETVGTGGQKYTSPISLELVHVNGHYFKDIMARDLTPLSEEYKKTLREQCASDQEFEETLDSFVSYQLPGYESWPDADAVIAEFAAEEKVLIGSGSGRSGKDGLGRLRRVWRKRGSHRKNDFLDCAVYADARAMRSGISEWTQEMVTQAIEQAELGAKGIKQSDGARMRGGQRIGRTDPRRSDTIATTIAEQAAEKRIF